MILHANIIRMFPAHSLPLPAAALARIFLVGCPEEGIDQKRCIQGMQWCATDFGGPVTQALSVEQFGHVQRTDLMIILKENAIHGIQYKLGQIIHIGTSGGYLGWCRLLESMESSLAAGEMSIGTSHAKQNGHFHGLSVGEEWEW